MSGDIEQAPAIPEERPRGPIEIRSTGEIVGADFEERTIEIVVIPYEQETTVPHNGRMIREVVAPGAFDGIERRAKRVRVNYQHRDDDLRFLLGKARAFYPRRPEGLVASLLIGRGDEGDMALHKAAEGVLGGSAGFGIFPGGEAWPSRNLRRLTKLFLDHVALTPTPAYPGAEVLAVRAEQPIPVSATPNLDLVRSWKIDDRLKSDPLYR